MNNGETLKQIVADMLGCNPNQIQPTDRFVEDLGADSLDCIEIVIEVENLFGLNIPDADAEKLATFAEALAYVERHA